MAERIDNMNDQQSDKHLPTSFVELQKEFQEQVIRNETQYNRWAEQPAEVPWEVRFRSLIATTATKVLIPLIGFIVGWLILASSGVRFYDVRTGFECLKLDQELGSVRAPCVGAEGVIATVAKWLSYPDFNLSFLPAGIPILLFMILAWYVLRGWEFLWKAWDDPRDYNFYKRYAASGIFIFRSALLVLIIASIPLIAGMWPTSYSFVFFVSVSIVGLCIWFVLDIVTSMLEEKQKFEELKPSDKTVRSLWLDTLRFGRLISVLPLALFIAYYVHNWITDIDPLVYYFLAIGLYVLVGVLAGYVLLLVAHVAYKAWLEPYDRKHFNSATELVNKPQDHLIYDQEGGGIHKYQNHLASLTYVKPYRRLILRASLSLIGLLARFPF